MKPLVLLIIGPTATGKSKIALELAERLSGEIVSADSMLVYRELNIGTNKPSKEELERIPHHMINLISVEESFSVHDYYQGAMKSISNICQRGKLPIVVGGTGLYIRSLLRGMEKTPAPNIILRNKLETEWESGQSEAIYKRLLCMDEKRATTIKPGDKKRIIRALEIIVSKEKHDEGQRGQCVSLDDLGYRKLVIGLTKKRSLLYADINKRVDEMFESGLVKETEKVREKNLSITARQAIGYQEFMKSSKGTKESIIREEIKKHSRQFAKRQWTWFKKENDVKWIDLGDFRDKKSIVSEIMGMIDSA
ncbi:MAG: tRNA (adenosine(37)-N6)-dimethylallyltransferase MiaA [Candidatus Omnitrophica bacterium]|nr:tRNA (adenosine(37)-N6)-dimethylallyltransferase MiaA [Candidatus Omnitrophota bacterium]